MFQKVNKFELRGRICEATERLERMDKNKT